MIIDHSQNIFLRSLGKILMLLMPHSSLIISMYTTLYVDNTGEEEGLANIFDFRLPAVEGDARNVL